MAMPLLMWDGFWKYFVLGTLFWVVIDFTTVYVPDFQLWFSQMPDIWFFYLGIPLLFSIIFYKWRLKEPMPFVIMIVELFIIEILVVNNSLLYIFPGALLMIPTAIFLYVLITYVPKWIIDQEIFRHKLILIVSIILWIVATMFTYINHTA